MANSGLRLVASASWGAGSSWTVGTGGAEGGVVEGAAAATGAGLPWALREASREAVASWTRLAVPVAVGATGNRVAACRDRWNRVWARSWRERGVALAG
jgi:hypothetical protein